MSYKLVFLLAVIVVATTSLGLHSDCDGHGAPIVIPVTTTGGGGGGGGTPVATQTPDPFNDGGLTSFSGPVPPEIQEMTGATTWPAVYAWMLEQEAAAGVAGQSGYSSIVVTVGDEGAVEGVELISPPETPPEAGTWPPAQDEVMPEPTVEPTTEPEVEP